MDKGRKLELLQRLLGLKHKIKVHDSTKQPDTHEELAQTILAKWEFEDELAAIDELLADARRQNIIQKKASLERNTSMSPKAAAAYSAGLTTSRDHVLKKKEKKLVSDPADRSSVEASVENSRSGAIQAQL